MDCSCHSFNASLSFFHHPLSLSIKPTLSLFLSFSFFSSSSSLMPSSQLFSCYRALSVTFDVAKFILYRRWMSLHLLLTPALIHSHPGKNRTQVDRIKQCRFLYTDWHNLWIPERNLMSINKQIWRYFGKCYLHEIFWYSNVDKSVA